MNSETLFEDNENSIHYVGLLREVDLTNTYTKPDKAYGIIYKSNNTISTGWNGSKFNQICT